MKELELKDQLVENHRQIEQEKHYKFIGSMSLRRGHTLFEFDPSTGIVEPVEIIKKVAIDFNTKTAVKSKRASFKEDCYYITALNLKNAKKSK